MATMLPISDKYSSPAGRSAIPMVELAISNMDPITGFGACRVTTIPNLSSTVNRKCVFVRDSGDSRFERGLATRPRLPSQLTLRPRNMPRKRLTNLTRTRFELMLWSSCEQPITTPGDSALARKATYSVQLQTTVQASTCRSRTASTIKLQVGRQRPWKKSRRTQNSNLSLTKFDKSMCTAVTQQPQAMHFIPLEIIRSHGGTASRWFANQPATL